MSEAPVLGERRHSLSGQGAVLALQGMVGNRAVSRMLSSTQVREAARMGVSGPAVPYPHLAAIQRSFGAHDISTITAHTDRRGVRAAAAMGAAAFTLGDQVAFAGRPSLHTAAHEAAHVVQQRRGVHVPGGVGVAGDAHERLADAAADRVVRGQSAEALLGSATGAAPSPPAAVAPVQMATVLTVPTEDGEATEQYVRINVPPDGSCLLSAAHLGFVSRELLDEILAEDAPPSPDEIEQRVLGRLTAGLDDAEEPQESPEEEASQEQAEKELPAAQRAYDAANFATRVAIAGAWRDDPAAPASLRGDIQTIIFEHLRGSGLLKTERSQLAASKVPAPSLSALSTAKSSADDIAALTDEQFVSQAFTNPEAFSRKGSSKQVKLSSSSSAPRTLGVKAAARGFGMGIRAGGELSTALSAFVEAWITAHGQAAPAGADGAVNVVAGSVIAPGPGDIPQNVVDAYIDEFETNLALWAGETAARTLATHQGLTIHTFTNQGTHIHATVLGGAPTIHLYLNPAQTHYELMFGPFPEGFFDEQADLDDLIAFDDFDDFDESPSSVGELSSAEHDEADPSEILLEADAEPAPRFSFAKDPGLGFRLAAHASIDLREATDDTFHKAYADHLARRSRARPGSREPIVPLAGFVGQLLEGGVSLEELEELRKLASRYVEFHGKHSSWSREDALQRDAVLHEITALLNSLADKHHRPEWARGPSVAEFRTAPTNVTKQGGVAGDSMRALLTISPGELSGFEPESYPEWEVFNQQLRGFVRAHLLNKHQGGPGTAENLAFLSSDDNLLMSELGEEDVKRRVLENNEQLLYRVAMPKGRPELVQEPHNLAPALAAAIVRQVEMAAYPVVLSKPGDVSSKPILGKEIISQSGALAKHGRKGIGVSDAGIVIPASLPSEVVAKVQPHWGNVIAENRDLASTPSVLSFLPSADPGLLKQVDTSRKRARATLDSVDHKLAAKREAGKKRRALQDVDLSSLDEEKQAKLFQASRAKQDKFLAALEHMSVPEAFRAIIVPKRARVDPKKIKVGRESIKHFFGGGGSTH